MPGDNLAEILALVREEANLDADTTQRVELIIRDRWGGTAYYIGAKRKRSYLEQLRALPSGLTNEEIAERLGITDRHARRLRRLLRG